MYLNTTLYKVHIVLDERAIHTIKIAKDFVEDKATKKQLSEAVKNVINISKEFEYIYGIVYAMATTHHTHHMVTYISDSLAFGFDHKNAKSVKKMVERKCADIVRKYHPTCPI